MTNGAQDLLPGINGGSMVDRPAIASSFRAHPMNRVLRHPHQRFQLPNTPSPIRRLRVIRWLRSVSAKLKGFPRVAFAEAAPCLPGATAELSPAPAVPRGYRDAATAGLQTAPRVGAVESDPVLGRSDTWQNILASSLPL